MSALTDALDLVDEPLQDAIGAAEGVDDAVTEQLAIAQRHLYAAIELAKAVAR